MDAVRLVLAGAISQEDLDKMPFSYTLTTCGWKRKTIATTLFLKTGEVKEYEYDDSRCVAISNDLEELKDIAETNACDIHEGCYQYIVIEKVYHSLYPPCEKVMWYEWIPLEGGDKYEGHYQECEEPEEYKQIVGFGIG